MRENLILVKSRRWTEKFLTSFFSLIILKKSIQILTVKPSCGCTTPDWSKKEVKPGKEGFIVAEYNPKGRPGVFRKSLSVVTSDNKRSVIFIKGKVSR